MTVIRRNISLPPELNKRLVEQAAKEDRTIAAIVRRALELYFELERQRKERDERQSDARH